MKTNKSSEAFKAAISAKLAKMAKADPLFAVTLKKENKNIDDCITYIFNTVEKSGCNGFTDDEIYGMAVHYYDEDGIEIGKKRDYQVIVNHKIVPTKQEIAEAIAEGKKDARNHAFSEELKRLRPNSNVSSKPSAPDKTKELTLF